MAIPFEVEVQEDAITELADLWNNGTREQRDRITRAAHEIERSLSEDAHKKGFASSRKFPQRRFYVKNPLVAHFEVSLPQGKGKGKVVITAFKEAQDN